jgi:hypothetical protein
MAQRWRVGSSEAAWPRAEPTVSHAQPRAYEAIATPRCHWPAHRVETPAAAPAALGTLATAWTDPQVASSSLSAHQREAGQGRPTPTTPITAITWPIHADARPDEEPRGDGTPGTAGVGGGTTVDAHQVREAEIMQAYKGQAQAEGGVRFRKDPLCLVSSWFVKTPSRLQGLRMVMTRALRVYAGAPRRRRQPLARHHETVPTHINPPPRRPT